ncbi:MAG: site-2 protease family protein [Ilumatobacteraceae bacterium]|nr:MAG: site-2 protease family protein [Actinomycetota bacterium]
MPGSIKIGKLFGVPVMVHWSLAVAAVLVAANLSRVATDDGSITAVSILVSVLAALAFFASVLAHELSHSLTARHYGVETERITLWALGGMAYLADEPPTPRAQGWIAAAGPIASLVLGLIGVGAAFALHAAGFGDSTLTIVAWLGVINVALALFNVLPGAPLDGGRILAAVRWRIHGDRYRAMEEATTAGRVVGWLVAGIGLWLVLEGAGGFFILLTGVFIAFNASAERAGIGIRRRLDGLTVTDLTWYGIAHAPGDTDAETMLWQRNRLGMAKVVAVDDEQGHIAGIVAEDQLWKVPEDQRPYVRLRQLATPLTRFGRARPDEPLTSALNRLNPYAPMLTVWQGDRLVGVVTTERLQKKVGDH